MKKYLMFFVFLIAHSSWASLYPIITSINPVAVASDGWDYYITQTLVNIGSAGDVIVPRGQGIGFGHRHNPTSTPGSGVGYAQAGWVESYGNSTVSQLGVELYNTGGKNITSIPHSGLPPSTNECVAYMLLPGHGTYPWSQVKTPGGCLNVPPADQWCKLKTPQILLDHGVISLTESAGDSASASIDVECVSDMAVSFRLVTDDIYIYLDEGKSEITVDNKPLTSKIDLPQGNSTLSIKDLLTGVTTEGVHTGSSVLVMMPY